MSAAPLAFKQTDVARALRAVSKAHDPFYVRIERATGDILILPGAGEPVQGAAASAAGADNDDLDSELEGWAAGQG